MASGDQLDLFAGGFRAAAPVMPERARHPALAPDALDDATLVAALPEAGLADCRDLAAEAVRRGLIAAVPALEALCRRFRGFGRDRAVPEQAAAVDALAALGGRDAAAAMVRLVVAEVVQGPGLAPAVQAAAALSARLPADCAVALLRHAAPAIRAAACRCAPPQPMVITALIELLDDLHPEVASAAACTLGELMRPEARPLLARLLRAAPTAAVIAACAGVADAELIVQLGRVARVRPDLARAAMAALTEIDDPRAAIVLAGLKS